MADVGVYLIPLAIFLAVVVILRMRPRGVERQRDLGLRGERQAARLLARGRKIDAISLVRERTGLSLTEAKELVERIEASRKGGNGVPERTRTSDL